MRVFQILIDGFAISALYALGATGFTLIFGVSGVLNLSHGAIMVMAAVAANVSLVVGYVKRKLDSPSPANPAAVGAAATPPSFAGTIWKAFQRVLGFYQPIWA